MSIRKNVLLGGLGIALASAMLVGYGTSADAAGRKSYAKFNKKNELLRPVNYREWVFLGAPVTPKDMNNGKPAFPEFHNVYIDPASWAHWKKKGEFRDGTIIVKELTSVGSKQAVSGNGYFPGEFNGIAAMVKDKKRFGSSPKSWAFFGFSSYEAKTGTLQEEASCSSCHQAGAKTDMVFSQYYPVLRAGAPKK